MPEHHLSAVSRSLFLTILVILFLSLSPVTGQADPPAPQTPPIPVRAPAGLPQVAPSAVSPAPALSSALPPLKAVIFVGPIDGDNGSWTLDEISNAQLAASALRSHGVNVQEFYPNQANGTWANIKAAAVGAHFIIYRGHGVYWGDMPTPPVGGFALKDAFVSNEMIRSELKPAPNAIVMLYGCFTAGSAGNDTISISLDEARRRVTEYSHPFLDIGAGGYFADWFGDAFPAYVNSLFAGQTLRQAYESYSDFNAGRIWRGVHSDHPQTPMFLGWDNWYDPMPQYNNAFVGQADKTLVDLFGNGNEMVLDTNAYFSLLQKDWPAETNKIAVRGSNPSVTFTWQATVTNPPAWFTLASPASGTSGQSLIFYLDPTKTTTGGSVTIHVSTATAEVQNASQDIQVTLFVADQVTHTYMPTLAR